MKIEELMAMPVIGNHHSDQGVWDAAHEIAANAERPMVERLKALEKMNELTGVNEPCNEAALQEYLAAGE